MKYTGLYNKKFFKDSDRFQRDEKRLDFLVSKILEHNPLSVLDVGCGSGYLVKKLRTLGIKAFGIDISPDAGKQIPNWFMVKNAISLPFDHNEFDLVVSTDFFEHLSEDEIDDVYKEMKWVGKKVIAQVAWEDKLNARQKLLHLTNKPRSWWENKLPDCEFLGSLQ